MLKVQKEIEELYPKSIGRLRMTLGRPRNIWNFVIAGRIIENVGRHSDEPSRRLTAKGRPSGQLKR